MARLFVSLLGLIGILFVVAGYLWAAWLAAGGDELPIAGATIALWIVVAKVDRLT